MNESAELTRNIETAIVQQEELAADMIAILRTQAPSEEELQRLVHKAMQFSSAAALLALSAYSIACDQLKERKSRG